MVSFKLVIIGSGNGLSPVWHQTITWTNADLLSIGRLGTYFSETLIKIQYFLLKKMYFKCRLQSGVHFVQTSIY